MKSLYPDSALVLIARCPELGRVKTRLQASLAPELVLQVYKAFLGDTIERLLAITHTYVYLTGDCVRQPHRLVNTLQLDQVPEFRAQSDGDLGHRMWEAYKELSAVYKRIVFLGTDSPSLPASIVCDALTALGRAPVTIGPAEDGGYYLIGLSQPRPQLFRDMPWGTAHVLNKTLERVRPKEVALLETWYDVDTFGDLERLWIELSALQVGNRTRRVLEQLFGGDETRTLPR